MDTIERLVEMLNEMFIGTDWYPVDGGYNRVPPQRQLVKHNNKTGVNVKGSGEITKKLIIPKRLPSKLRTKVLTEEIGLGINERLRNEFVVSGEFMIHNNEIVEYSTTISTSDAQRIFSLNNPLN